LEPIYLTQQVLAPVVGKLTGSAAALCAVASALAVIPLLAFISLFFRIFAA
jgi:hypothetical protein